MTVLPQPLDSGIFEMGNGIFEMGSGIFEMIEAGLQTFSPQRRINSGNLCAKL